MNRLDLQKIRFVIKRHNLSVSSTKNFFSISLPDNSEVIGTLIDQGVIQIWHIEFK